ncbi:MAG: zinc ribbon domain-containing protein [Thermoleophilia bacterium]|nr:zinc ribbon domain-containing protein [Thermoleophilia bacterium]
MANGDRPGPIGRRLSGAVLALAALALLLTLLPAQPAAAAPETQWVLTQTLVNPDKEKLEYRGGGSDPEFFGEERFKDMVMIFKPSATSFSVKDRWQDREYIAWDVTITCNFSAPGKTLLAGKPYKLTAKFSHTGTTHDPHPGEAFSYSASDFSLDPNEPLSYYPSNPGPPSKTWSFTAPTASPGATMEIYAGLWNSPGCAVIWKYEARAVAPETTTTTRPVTTTQPVTTPSSTTPGAPVTTKPSTTTSTSATGPGDAGTRIFTEEEFGKMLADTAAFAETYESPGGDIDKNLLRQGYIGFIWSSEGDLSIYDHSGREVDSFDPRFWDDNNGSLKPIRIGDTIRTVNGKGTVFIFTGYSSDEHTLEIGNDTEVVFTRFGTTDQEVSTTVLEMLKGMIRYVGHVGGALTRGWRSDSIFSVRAGTTICGIRGSDVVISYNAEEEIVGAWVHEGLMDVTSERAGETKVLIEGEGLVVEGGELGAVLSLTEDRWADIALASKGDDVKRLTVVAVEQSDQPGGRPAVLVGFERDSNLSLILAVVIPVVVVVVIGTGLGLYLLRRRRRRAAGEAALPAGGEPAAPAGVAGSADGHASSPTFCRHCGSPRRPGIVFCESCGKKLDA